MEFSIHSEVVNLYSKLLDSQTLFRQMGQVEFVTQPKEIIYRENKLILYHYQSKLKKAAQTPLLIVFALINRPDILDFSPDHSLIRNLLEAGRDVYLIDWGYPSAEDKDISWSVYIKRYLKNCIKKIKQKSAQSSMDLLGICQGGVMSLCYASLFPQDIKRLILISTSVNFQTEKDILSLWAQKIPIASLRERPGNVPGSWLAQAFSSIRPFQVRGKKYLALLDHLSAEKPDQAWLKDFFLLEKWQLDTPDQTSLAFTQFIQWFYQQNSLIQGKLFLEKDHIDLKKLNMPILNLAARDDHIVPPSASRALKRYVQSKDYSFKTLPSGHVGIYISRKTREQLPKLILSWLKDRDGKVW